MILIPYEKQTLVSSLSLETTQTKLSSLVDTQLKWYQRPSNKSFRGEISDAQFRIHRNIFGRNSYLPIIKGRLEPTLDGTIINLYFYIHPMVVIGLLAFVIGSEAIAIAREGRFNLILLAAFIGFHCLMYMIGYLPERRKAERFIREYLHASNA